MHIAKIVISNEATLWYGSTAEDQVLCLFHACTQKHFLSHHKLSISSRARGCSVIFSCRTQKQNQEVCKRLQPRMQPESPLSLQKQGASCGPALPPPPPCPGPATPVAAYLRLLIRGPQRLWAWAQISSTFPDPYSWSFASLKTSLIRPQEEKRIKRKHKILTSILLIYHSQSHVNVAMNMFFICLPVFWIYVSVKMVVIGWAGVFKYKCRPTPSALGQVLLQCCRRHSQRWELSPLCCQQTFAAPLSFVHSCWGWVVFMVACAEFQWPPRPPALIVPSLLTGFYSLQCPEGPR